MAESVTFDLNININDVSSSSSKSPSGGRKADSNRYQDDRGEYNIKEIVRKEMNIQKKQRTNKKSDDNSEQNNVFGDFESKFSQGAGFVRNPVGSAQSLVSKKFKDLSNIPTPEEIEKKVKKVRKDGEKARIKLEDRSKKSLKQFDEKLEDKISEISGGGLNFIGGGGKGLAKAIPIVGTAITVALLVKEIVPEIIKLLGKKGFPLNRDFRRLVETEINSAISQNRKLAQLLGEEQIITSNAGYGTVGQPTSSLENKLRNRIAKSDLAIEDRVFN